MAVEIVVAASIFEHVLCARYCPRLISLLSLFCKCGNWKHREINSEMRSWSCMIHLNRTLNHNVFLSDIVVTILHFCIAVHSQQHVILVHWWQNGWSSLKLILPATFKSCCASHFFCKNEEFYEFERNCLREWVRFNSYEIRATR